jgi:cell division protein FtsN
MIKTERRKTSRTTLNRLAYINLESNNGAIVLNVSDEGLCFHSVAPVQRNETIRFWFLEHNRRIEANGNLSWIDESQKTGGLRFTNLSTEASLQIRDWVNQPATPPIPLSSLSPSKAAAFHTSRSDRKAMDDDSAALEVRSPSINAPAFLRGFSGGLVFGVLVSTLVAATFLLYNYHREFGDSLIQLGERLGAKHQSSTVPPTPDTVSSAQKVTPFLEKGATQLLTKSARPQQAKIEAPAPVSTTRAPAIAASATAATPAISPPPPIMSLPTSSVEPDASHLSDKAGAVPEFGSVNQPSPRAVESREEEAGSSSTMFFEVGKFHDQTGADRATDQLKQFGFHATINHKGHLWMNTYQVLVGPYGGDDEAKAAQKNLVSRGFRPRAYERGSRNFTFHSLLTVNGTHIPDGIFVVSWESYVPEAIVKFEKEGSVLGTTEGKWVKRGVKYEDDAVVYRKNSDGSRTLLEIRFAGMSQALVFGKSS